MTTVEVDLDTLLKAPGTDQHSFMQRLVEVLERAEWREIHIQDPRNLYRALGYICSWVFYPDYPELLEKLPGNITTLHDSLTTALCDLRPRVVKLYSAMQDCEFADIFTQPWALALILLHQEHAETLLGEMALERVMPALLFNLTYVPSKRMETSGYLSALVQKPEGVYTLIQTFAQGEHKDILRSMAVKVLSSLPKGVDKSAYINSILTQCVRLLLHFHCEAYFRSIVSDTAANLIQRYPEHTQTEFLSLLRSALNERDVTGAIRTLSALAAREPPPSLLLYVLEEHFAVLLALDRAAAKYPILPVTSEVRGLLIQTAKYSDSAASLLYEGFIVPGNPDLSFTLEDDIMVKTVTAVQEPAVTYLEHNITLLQTLAQSPLSSKVCSQLFSLLLCEYTQTQSPIPLLYIASMAETLPAELLVQSNSQLSVFLRAALKETSSDTWLLALSLLSSVLDHDLQSLDKPFLLSISQDILPLLSFPDPALSSAAQHANSLISRSLTLHSLSPSTPSNDLLPTHLLSDLHSTQPYERAFALHKMSLLPPNQLQSSIVLPELYRLIGDSDSFVFQNVLKLALRLLKLRQKDVIEGIMSQYRVVTDWVSKAHVLELLFHIIISLGRVTVYTWAPQLMQFLSTTEDDELLVNGKLSVLGELVKYLGPALHPYLWYVVGLTLSCLRTANSAVYLHKSVPTSLSPTLIIVDKLMKNSPFSHIQPHLSEYISLLSTLDSLSTDLLPERPMILQVLDSASLLSARQYGVCPS